ncbi:MAG: triose-phosphate isomerase [Candidatus Methanofastidiosia archaeon]
MKGHLIVVNFKAYENVCGAQGLALAATCEKVGKETGITIVACPQMVDLALTVTHVTSPVWAQGLHSVPPGGRTGHTTAEALVGAGAKGVLINHSENREMLFDIDAIVKSCKKNSITSCVCTNNINVSCSAAMLGPDFVAIEPPELIGGDVSVTTADPKIVSATVTRVKEINKNVEVLCGAGVKNSRDVKAALELGAKGVLLASGVVKAKDPETVLRDLASAM